MTTEIYPLTPAEKYALAKFNSGEANDVIHVDSYTPFYTREKMIQTLQRKGYIDAECRITFSGMAALAEAK